MLYLCELSVNWKVSLHDDEVILVQDCPVTAWGNW